MAKAMVEAAIKYRDHGFSVIPCGARDKFPDFEALRASRNLDRRGRPTWRALQQRLPSDDEINSWFGSEDRNLGLVTGFGELLILDFDAEGAFESWSHKFPELAAGTSVQRSARGHHVLFRWSGVWTTRYLTAIGFQLPESRGRAAGAVKGRSDYVVAWPSIHPSGKEYHWLPGQAPWEAGISRIASLQSIGIELMSPFPGSYFRFARNFLTEPRLGMKLLVRWFRNKDDKSAGRKSRF